ncbi:MAG: hypothetical protein HQ483_08080 [Rhodospirillales bacterium]|nr:hypothetical protein [Rhodospirillales bacterium]
MKPRNEFAANSGNRNTALGSSAPVQFHAASAIECNHAQTPRAVPPIEIKPWLDAFTPRYVSAVWRGYPKENERAWERLAVTLGIEEAFNFHLPSRGAGVAADLAYLELPVAERMRLSRIYPIETFHLLYAASSQISDPISCSALMERYLAPEVVAAANWKAQNTPRLFFKITGQRTFIN